ncbi:adipocyte plasma membrane-associated protein Hemomucin-like [Toxorhynchites rutilus septentrionalis]|uniref:adipocyte plasma membrane-associated protein Hemomucin-like n=1 Tax=Toxorhynchites rutilus septentrionalis TaxID=329112 RepID=UPI0024796F35|nr:adipocyte plasma membrane-associated protein Hemomucin-like [Toxorhynchites rutilus septentrionalis]
MRRERCFLLTIAVFLLLQCSTAMTTSLATAAKAAALQTNLNATVSKVIESLEENTYRGDSVVEQSSSQEQQHVKKAKIVARKGVDMNMTAISSAPIVASKDSEAQQPLSSDKVGNHNATTEVIGNATMDMKTNNHSATTSLTPKATTSTTTTTTSSTTTTTTSTSSTTTTTTTTTTTSTTTTKPPKKPKVTFSVDDEPKLLQAAKPGYNAPSTAVSDVNGRLHVEEPMAELSKEYIAAPSSRGHREYVVPVVTLIFAIPLLMGLFLLSYRRAKEFWLTRHYRRMDFLVDGMYNY